MNDSPLSVLLIADAREVARLRQLLRIGLASQDDIAWAPDAANGLDLLCSDRPAVCLLDAALVQDSGRDLIRRARARGCFTPVIVLLPEGNEENEANEEAAGWLARSSLTAGLLQRTLHSVAARHRDYVALQEEALRKSAVIDAALDAMVAIDRTGRFIEFNPAAERTFGLRRDEAIGRRLVDTIVPPALRDAHNAGFARHLATGDERLIGRRIEITGCRADGSEFPLELAITRTTLADGPIFSAQIRDISDRKAAEAALRASESRAHDFVERASHGIYRAALDGRILSANPSLVRMLGYERVAEVLGLNLEEGVFVEGAQRRALVDELRRTGTSCETEVLWRRRDGELRTVRLRAHPILTRDGQLEAVETVAEDVTERRLLEQQLLQAQKMESVGQLAGGIAHDFNNLLTAILGYSDLLLEQMHPEDRRREDLREIRRAADRAASLTRQLLAFSRQQILQPVAMDLNATMDGLAEMIRRLIGEHIHVELRLEEGLGQILADPGQIEQVIVNLAVNARDAMPGGGLITFATEAVEVGAADVHHRDLTPGAYALLRVIDTGVGMAPEIASRIFEPFFTTKEAGKGTGLGLATVYGIVKQTGGTLSVSSAPGEGSVFELYFPQTRAPIVAAPAARDTPRGGSETILLVEDESSVRDLTAEVLNRAGYRVLTAKDGKRALEIAGTNAGAIHLLLTDVVMPGISGRELADRLVAAHPAARVLFMSGYTDDAIVQHGVLNAGTEFLQKPFTGAALAARVRQVLDGPGPAS